MRFVFGVLLLGLALGVNGQRKPVNTIEWSPLRPLQLSDFRVARPGNYVPEAIGTGRGVTRTGFSYSLTNVDRDSVKARNLIKVSVVMYPDDSYIMESVVKAGKEEQAYWLAHEQRHFDISEIYARELIRYFNTSTLYTKTIGGQITELIKRLYAEAAALHKKYEEETQKGNNRKAQGEWNKYIADRLSALSSYTRKEFYLHVIF